MNTLDIKAGERVKYVHFTEDSLSVDLIDGRTISVPAVLVSPAASRVSATTQQLASMRQWIRHPLAGHR